MLKEYTVREVAELISKHEETIKRWIRTESYLTHTETVTRKVGEYLNQIY